MREQFLFKTLAASRGALLEQVEKCPPDKLNVVPAGFNTSIHWQLGHIVKVTEEIVFEKSGEEPTLPLEYKTFFGYGTRPSEWTGAPPSWEETLSRFKDQITQLHSVFAGKLDAKAEENPFKGETVEELLFFNFFHESVHTGNILAMLRAFGLKGVGG